MADEGPPDKPALTRVSLTKARAELGALVKRVAAGNECVIIEKDGLSVAALIAIDELEDYLELNDPEVRAAIAEGREEYLAGKSRPAEELLRELEEEEERERQPENAAR
ncbi:MAG: Antitoxin Phd YefM, type toxin-antitoxin system [Microvirga sp.]|jgi:prevent-host-death family protein|nr:Antitoxin Phd YefM, type toxin-antitoxin system [Geminicoccaceae bacterium]MDF2973851.1 Antitoxin Phd YefM, type toxin-antitoxin system [Microvirga sp.]